MSLRPAWSTYHIWSTERSCLKQVGDRHTDEMVGDVYSRRANGPKSKNRLESDV